MPAPQITPEGIAQVRAIVAVVVRITRTKNDDEMLAKINPFLDTLIASDLFPPLLDFVNSLLENRFGSTAEQQAAVPDGVDRESFELFAAMVADELRGN